MVAFFLTFFTVFAVEFLFVGFYDHIFRFKDRSFCDQLGWHDGRGGSQGFDGCNMKAVCSRCGKKVIQDSQGNWF